MKNEVGYNKHCVDFSFQIFGSLIQRKLIALELSDRMPILVSMLNQEMDESKIIYQKQMNRSVMISPLTNSF